MGELLAWYGGTFDPIHYGHLKPLRSLAQQIKLKHITLLPNHLPPHRPQPEASAQQRLTMLQLAIAGDPQLSVDDRELHRASPSYTADTLQQLRIGYGAHQPIAFIIGMDSLHTFPYWHNPQQILACSHLLVCRRPGSPDTLPASWLQSHLTQQIHQLHHLPGGKIFLADTPLYPISSSDIRTRRQQNLPCDDILPPAVLDYITRQQLYL